MTPQPDPESLSTLASLYQHGLYIPLAILVVYFALRWGSTHVTWLEQGKNAAYVAAALGGLATLVAPAAQGTTPNTSMLIAAALSVMTLLTTPTKLAKGGAALLIVAGLAGSAALGMGCHNAIATAEVNAAKTAAADAWDCAKQEYAAVTGGKSWFQLGITVAMKFAELVAKDGANPLAIAEDLAKDFGQPVVACTMAELRGNVAPSPAAGSGAGSSMVVMAPRASPAARAAAAVVAAKRWSYR